MYCGRWFVQGIVTIQIFAWVDVLVHVCYVASMVPKPLFHVLEQSGAWLQDQAIWL